MDHEITTYDLLCDLEDGMITYEEALILAREVDATDSVRLPARTACEIWMRELEFDTPFDGYGGDWRNDMDHLATARARGVIDAGQRNALAGIIYGNLYARAREKWEATREQAELECAEELRNAPTYTDLLGPDDPDKVVSDEQIIEWFGRL